MSSLNEHDQQLLQTLLNQAEAVAPPSDKPQSDHNSSLVSDCSRRLKSQQLLRKKRHSTSAVKRKGTVNMPKDVHLYTRHKKCLNAQESLERRGIWATEGLFIQSPQFQQSSLPRSYSQLCPVYRHDAFQFHTLSKSQSCKMYTRDFANTGNDLHNFWDNFIGDGTEAMQFDQQTSAPTFVGQQNSQQLQHTPDTCPSGASGSTFQGQGSSGFTSPQSGFSGVATGQSSVGGYQDQGHSFQQVQPSQTQSTQMNVSTPEGYQNQSSGFHQQFPVAGAMGQTGQLEKASSMSSGFPSQPQGFPQQYSMDTTATGAQSEVSRPFQTQGASFQPQTHTQFTDSSRQLSAQQQQQHVNQTDGVYMSSLPKSGEDQVSISAAAYQNQNSDSQQQQTFLSEYSTNSGTNNSSLQAVVQATGFQQQYGSGGQSQPSQERRDSNQQQPVEDFSSQVASFQQQQAGQQQALFQQGTQITASNSGEQSFQNSPADGTSMCFTDGMSAYPQQTGQGEQQGTLSSTTAVDSPDSLQAGTAGRVQQMQYQSPTPPTAQTDKGGAGAFQGQVSHYPKQQTFHSPAGSPGQPVASPPSFPQPSPDYDTHHNCTPPAPASVQGDQAVGLSYGGQNCGYPKQLSFNTSPAASPDQGGQVEGSVPSSPANSYSQHQSPAFSIQSPFPATGQPQNPGDQKTGGNFSPHTPSYSQALTVQGDQNVVNSFQAGAVYSPSNTGRDDPKGAVGFQTQEALHSHCSLQSDSSVHTESNNFQQPVFQTPTPPTAQSNVAAQPMQEGSGPSSIEAEAIAFLVQESLHSVNQQSQSLESNSSSITYQHQPISAPQTTITAQRDQPMETQQSPYMVGSGSNAGAFPGQTPASAPPPVFQETVTSVSQNNQAGTSFLNQALSFPAQPSGFQASSAQPVRPMSMSMESLVSGGSGQNEFANNSMTTNSFPDPASRAFSGQTILSSGPSASMAFSQTTSVASEAQCVTSVGESNQFNQLPSSSSDFNQFAGSVAPSFGRDSVQLQVQQQQVQQQQQIQQQKVHQQPVQQQVQQQPTQQQHFSAGVNQQSVQQTAFSNQPQTGGVSLVRKNSTHNLSSMVNEGLQISPFQAISSCGPASLAHQTPPVTVFGSQQFGVGQLQGQQLVAEAGTQHGLQTLSDAAASLQRCSVPNQLPFAPQATSTPAQSSAVCPVTHNSISGAKSPVASLQDSNQTNTALQMLTSVLQQIQSILPKAQTEIQQSIHASQSARNDNPEVVSQILQHHNNAAQISQLLQQQLLSAQSQEALNQGSQQAYQPVKQPVSASAVEQPNFLMQQSNQQQPFVPKLETQQQHQQKQEPISSQVPSSMVTSLAGSLGSHGITIGSDGQLRIGNQSIKLQLDSSSGPASVSLVPASAPVTTSEATVSMAGLTPSQSAAVGGLPVDLQSMQFNSFSSAAASSVSGGNLTHTINTAPTTVPSTGSSISQNTTVMPTSSFTQPLSVAGVGMGLSTPNTSSDTVPTEECAFPVPSSQPQAAQNAVVTSTSTVNTPPIANIFYPISSASRLENRMETSASSMSTPVPVGNFLNVTTGCASVLLNAFSLAVANGKQDAPGFKMGGFTVPEVSTNDNVFSTFARQNQDITADMDVAETMEGTNRHVRMDTDKPLGNLTPRLSSRKTSIDEELENKDDNTPNSVLRRILTMKDEDGNASSSKAGSPTPGNSPVEPLELFVDGNTQATLIEKSEKLRLSSEVQQDDEMHQSEFWTSVPSFVSASVEDFVPSKVHRGADDLDASSKHISVPSAEKLFDAGGATSNSAFVFTKFGAEEPGVRAFGSAASDAVTTAGTPNVTEERMSGIVSAVKSVEPLKLGHVPTASSTRPSTRRQKDPGLSYQFPSKVGDCELRILAQPEEQHRARYLTEGSRGAVKDRNQQGYPHIKLIGYNEPATLQVFIGSEAGRVKPHGFYQACRVCGKNSTHCNEREIDGTTVIEIEISPINDMQVYMDCVGILKLRNADVEKRIGSSKAKAKKKNSTKARLVFRCTLRKPDGTYFTLQTASTPILCTQPIGQPEISRLSLSEMCVNQTNDLFIIGKNFLKGTQIMFRELGSDEKEVKWETEAEIEVEYFQQTHLICRVPEYPRKDIEQPVACQIVAHCGGKVSDPQEFVYKPAMVMVKEENRMETEPSGASKALPFGVSPVALQLNRLVERTQHLTTSSAMFQLPPGAIPSICTAPTLPTPPRVVSSTSTQPLSSILKPATLCLPASAHTLTLGPPGVGGEGKSGVPVQFVLPPHGVGSAAVAVDSRQLGNQPPQLVLMPTPPINSNSGINSKSQPPVFTFTPTTSASSNVAAGGGAANSQAGAPTTTTSTPMILFLAGPPATTAGLSSSSSSSTLVNNSSATVPMSMQQSMSNGQVDSLLKQMLESSKINPS